MITDSDRRGVIREYERIVALNRKRPLGRRSKSEAIVRRLIAKHRISRSTFFDWRSRFGKK